MGEGIRPFPSLSYYQAVVRGGDAPGRSPMRASAGLHARSSICAGRPAGRASAIPMYMAAAGLRNEERDCRP